jgi:hypothetical protein
MSTPPTDPRQASAHGEPDPGDASEAVAAGPLTSEGSGSPPGRGAIIAAVALCLIVSAFFLSYSAAFGQPAARDLTIAVSAPARVVTGLQAAGGLHPQLAAGARRRVGHHRVLQHHVLDYRRRRRHHRHETRPGHLSAARSSCSSAPLPCWFTPRCWPRSSPGSPTARCTPWPAAPPKSSSYSGPTPWPSAARSPEPPPPSAPSPHSR